MPYILLIKDLLEELREEGLPPGWQRYWQGERREIEKQLLSVFAACFEGNLDFLREHPGSRHDVETMLRSARKVPDGDDPLLHAVFRNEELRLQRALDWQENATGQTSSARRLPTEKLHELWTDNIIRILGEYLHSGTLQRRWSLLYVLSASFPRIWGEWVREWNEWLRSDETTFRNFMIEEAEQMILSSPASVKVMSFALQPSIGDHLFEKFLRNVRSEMPEMLERDETALYEKALQIAHSTPNPNPYRRPPNPRLGPVQLGPVEGGRDDRKELIIRTLRAWLGMQVSNQSPLWARLANSPNSLPIAVHSFSYADFLSVARNEATLEEALQKYL